MEPAGVQEGGKTRELHTVKICIPMGGLGKLR